MSRHKALCCLMLSTLIVIIVMSACSSFSAGNGQTTPAPVLFVPPDVPGPITRVDSNGIRVQPEPIDDFLQNPGIGWQNAAATSSFLNLAETVAYSNRREIAWSDLNPSEGVYDWTALDEQMQAATSAGKQYSFRVYTMVGEDFGGHKVPEWVLDKGAGILSNGEPNYSSCVYQEEWGRFVNELVNRYDGNQDIAFIDISGYGNFNEWSWQDEQTQWDNAWDAGYQSGATSPELFRTLDGQARRRLADMFLGGTFDKHECLDASGQRVMVSYSYPGFQQSQLVMPYAGIVQSSQYVSSRRSDVGVRYDCLGRNGERFMEKIGDVVTKVWITAPVVFEFCKPDEVDLEDAKLLLENAHGSIVHDNTWQYDTDSLKELIKNAGYRYYLKETTLQVDERTVNLQMDWQNVGYAPSYPKMGQHFELYFYLVDSTGSIVHKERIPAEISQWLPSDPSTEPETGYIISHNFVLPQQISTGHYFAAVSIVDVRTATALNLAFGTRESAGWYMLTPLEIR